MSILPKTVPVLLGVFLCACGGTQQGQSMPTPASATPAERVPRDGLQELREVDESYYANVIRQINRCFRPPPGSGGGEAIVAFSIGADGQVSAVRLEESSGDSDLDSEALDAIRDCAGRGRFGPLPEGLDPVPLPIRFTFGSSGSAGRP